MLMFGAVVCFAITFAGILFFIFEFSGVNRSPKRSARRQVKPRGDGVRTPQLLAAIARLDRLEGKPKKPERKKINKRTDSAKYKQLLGMLNGDRDTADNLVRAYGVDKAIEDLIRDRR